MEHKTGKARLRLVKTEETQAKPESHVEPKVFKSALAQQLAGFADDLDAQIAAILDS